MGGPVTSTGTSQRNVDGQVIAITVFSSVRWWGRAWLPALFWVVRRFPGVIGTLRELSFIHFARWTLVHEIPHNGDPQPRGRLRHTHLYFESNFNGGWEEYIDAFSHILTRGMWIFWGSSYGFPRALPVAPFKAYIKENETAASHYWAAYPQATVTMVKAALELNERLEPLVASAVTMTADEFAAAYARLLTDVQRAL